jgi:hypothetical protein
VDEPDEHERNDAQEVGSTARRSSGGEVDDLETEAIAKKLFKAWWGRRGPIQFEDQDTESWFAVARAAQRMGARSFTVIPRRTRT